MATVRFIETHLNNFLNLTEAKPNTVFCDKCDKFLEEKIEKPSTSKTFLLKTSEKLQCNLCGLDLNNYTYFLHLESFKFLLKTGEKTNCSICKKDLMILTKLDNITMMNYMRQRSFVD